MEITRNTIANEVKDILADGLRLDKEELSENALLGEELGAESIDILDIAFRIERKFNLRGVHQEIKEMTTVDEIIKYVKRKTK